MHMILKKTSNYLPRINQGLYLQIKCLGFHVITEYGCVLLLRLPTKAPCLCGLLGKHPSGISHT